MGMMTEKWYWLYCVDSAGKHERWWPIPLTGHKVQLVLLECLRRGPAECSWVYYEVGFEPSDEKGDGASDE